MSESSDLRELICEVGRRVYQRGFVAANDGNISTRLANGNVLITPTGVSKGFLTPDMLIEVDPHGEVVRGNYRPSTETKMHLRVYRERPDVHGVVHAHPPYATVFACAGTALEKKLMPEAILSLGSVPVAKYGMPTTEEIPDAVAPYLHDYSAVLLENHGTLTWAKDLQAAYFKMETLEFYAQITMLSQNLPGVKEIPPGEVERLIELRQTLGL